MRRLVLSISVLCALVVLAPVAGAGAEPADAAKAKQAKKPTVRIVAPMRVTVGRTVVIRGGLFSRSLRRNTVIFRSPDRRVAFAKPIRAFPRKLVVRVPASVERLLRKEGGDASKGLPTRLQLRVITRKRFGRLTSERRSPLVVSALRTGAPAACGTGSDFDNDFLSNDLEARLKTDPCRADTDGDGVEDGFEYESARDLNQRAVPYPGKRAFANALDPIDAGNDYDGDGMSLIEEFRAWAKTDTVFGPLGSRTNYGNHSLPMNYSDGRQSNVGSDHPEYDSRLDLDRDGRLSDDERDADGDGLNNIDELGLLMGIGHYPTEAPTAEGENSCAYGYDPALPRPFAETDYLDPDTDGDGVWDGADDQDTDGFTNAEEVAGPYQFCDEDGPFPVDRAPDGGVANLRHPYNPCLPNSDSATCARYRPKD